MFNRNRQTLKLTILSGVLAIAAVSDAADLLVPIPYITIQSAIDAAANGDIVKIAPGTYNENISVGGKNITIQAFNTNFDTIIDGGAAAAVVTFSGSETPQCMLRNLILRNGKANQGAGINGNATMATIKNCTITGNVAAGSGGGVYGHSGLLQKCVITLNQAINGAGIAGSEGKIDACKITLNKATASGGGFHDVTGVIQYSEISGNIAGTMGGGLNQINATVLGNLVQGNGVTATGANDAPASWGAGINDCSGTITLNTIIDNMSYGDGGGIANSSGLIQNNIIAKNSARRGGGLADCNGRIENNTIWENYAASQAGGCLNLGSLVSNCIIYGNSAPANPQWAGSTVPTYSCVQMWGGGQADIITAAPQMEDPVKGKYRLLSSSPCVDAGKFIAGLNTDFEGDFRPYDGSAEVRGDGSNFDIGADEFMPANIDLAADWASVKTKYKKAVPKLKVQMQGKLVVSNVGAETVASPFSIHFYLSDDAILDATDQVAGKPVNAKNLKVGKTKKAKCKVKMPLNEAVTGKFLIALADSGNSVDETTEANNIAVYGPLP